VGGGQNAHVDRHSPVGADRAHFMFLQHTQQLDLQPQRQIADFVEEQRAARSFLEQPFTRAQGAGESAFDMTEQFRLQQRFRDGGAVDRHERAGMAWAGAVNGARQELLAGAGFTADQHADITSSDQHGLRQQRIHTRTGGDDIGTPGFNAGRLRPLPLATPPRAPATG
jgi:hypothetical protein